MAIEQIGSAVTITSDSQDGTQSINVPSDCDFIVLFHPGAQDSDDEVFDSTGASHAVLSLANTEFVHQGRTTFGNDNGDISVHTFSSPPPGNQIFSQTNSQESYGKIFLLIFYKGVDINNPTGPVLDVKYIFDSYTLSGITTAPGSMTVACVANYSIDASFDTNGQTIIIGGVDQFLYNYVYTEVCEKLESSSITFTASSLSYPALLAISLSAATASGLIDIVIPETTEITSITEINTGISTQPTDITSGEKCLLELPEKTGSTTITKHATCYAF